MRDSQDIDLALLGTNTTLDFERAVLFSLHNSSKLGNFRLSQLNLLKLSSAPVYTLDSPQ